MPTTVVCDCGKENVSTDLLPGGTLNCHDCGKTLDIPTSSDSIELDDSENDLELEGLDAERCPSCGAELPEESVLCVQCGFNKKLGRRMGTQKIGGGSLERHNTQWNCSICDIDDAHRGKASWALGWLLISPSRTELFDHDVCLSCRGVYDTRRLGAFAIDLLIAGLLFALPVVLYRFGYLDQYLSVDLLMEKIDLGNDDFERNFFTFNGVLMPALLLSLGYLLLRDSFRGRSIGKKLLGLRAIDERTFRPTGLRRSLQRNLAIPMLIFIWPIRVVFLTLVVLIMLPIIIFVPKILRRIIGLTLVALRSEVSEEQTLSDRAREQAPVSLMKRASHAVACSPYALLEYLNNDGYRNGEWWAQTRVISDKYASKAPFSE